MLQSIFSNRMSAILLAIGDRRDYISTTSISRLMNLSTRTILRELKGINHFLEPFHLELETKTGQGMRLVGETEAIADFLESLQKQRGTHGVLEAAERKVLLTIECLKQRESSKLSYFAQRYKVSEGTISRDLSELEPWFLSYGLWLIRKQGYGIEIQGSEENFRKATIDFVHERLKENDLNRYLDGRLDFDEYVYFQSLEYHSIFNLLDKRILYRVIDLLRQRHQPLLNEIAQNSFIGLIIHLTVAIERIEKQEYIEVQLPLLEKLKQDDLYQGAKDLVHDFERAFSLVFPENEIIYVLMHLKSTRKQTSTGLELENHDIRQLAQKMIDDLGLLCGRDFGQDRVLLDGLMSHLEPALNRIQYHLDIRNPYLLQIQQEYTGIYELARKVCEMNTTETVVFSADEIAYLAMHFGAAIERQEASFKAEMTLMVGVVCASGIGISSFLASQIKNRFSALNDVIAISVEQVMSGSYPAVDLLLTTIELEDHVNALSIPAILSEKDFQRLEAAMRDTQKQKTSLVFHPQRQPYDRHLIDAMTITSLASVSVTEIWDSLLADVDLSLKEVIVSALADRELIGPVILSSQHFVLYHASVEGLPVPIIRFFTLSEPLRVKQQLIHSGLMMLIAKGTSPAVQATCGLVSALLLDDPLMIQDVNQHDLEGITMRIVDAMEKNNE